MVTHDAVSRFDRRVFFRLGVGRVEYICLCINSRSRTQATRNYENVLRRLEPYTAKNHTGEHPHPPKLTNAQTPHTPVCNLPHDNSTPVAVARRPGS